MQTMPNGQFYLFFFFSFFFLFSVGSIEINDNGRIRTRSSAKLCLLLDNGVLNIIKCYRLTDRLMVSGQRRCIR